MLLISDTMLGLRENMESKVIQRDLYAKRRGLRICALVSFVSALKTFVSPHLQLNLAMNILVQRIPVVILFFVVINTESVFDGFAMLASSTWYTW